MTEQIYLDRLETLARFFDDLFTHVDPNQYEFDMQFYHSQRKTNGCKTHCCILGFAGLIPEFQTEGLITGPGNNSVTFEEYCETIAGRMFFGLNYEEGEYLFHDYYIKLEDVPNKIRTLIEKKKGSAS